MKGSFQLLNSENLQNLVKSKFIHFLLPLLIENIPLIFWAPESISRWFPSTLFKAMLILIFCFIQVTYEIWYKCLQNRIVGPLCSNLSGRGLFSDYETFGPVCRDFKLRGTGRAVAAAAPPPRTRRRGGCVVAMEWNTNNPVLNRIVRKGIFTWVNLYFLGRAHAYFLGENSPASNDINVPGGRSAASGRSPRTWPPLPRASAALPRPLAVSYHGHNREQNAVRHDLYYLGTSNACINGRKSLLCLHIASNTLKDFQASYLVK